MIISASRRCDIPSHFGEWFVNRLKEGYVLIQNPYNKNRLSRAELTPQTVDIIVFWTKNPKPFLNYLHEIDEMGYPYYFEFTLTPYGKETEKHLPDKEELMEIFIKLSKKIGKNRIVWRYDPIIIDGLYDLHYHKEKFSYMAKKLKDSTNTCVISFVDSYKNERLRENRAMTVQNIHRISEMFSKIAQENDLDIYTCAERYDLEQFGIKHGACIDKNIIEGILHEKIESKKDKNQRAECMCIESIDIGTYNCCANGCTYCYALQNEKTAEQNIKNHDKNSPMLMGKPSGKEIITYRNSNSIIKRQLSLFD